MVWEAYRCGHRGGIAAHRIVGLHHLVRLGDGDLGPCEPDCMFQHEDREVGEQCPRCRDMDSRDDGDGSYSNYGRSNTPWPPKGNIRW